MASRRPRTHTPGPRHRRKGAADGSSEENYGVDSEIHSETDAPSASGSEQIEVSNSDHGPVADRQCTDVICVFFFIACFAYLLMSAWNNYNTGDLRVLRNGFDFRGELCGTSADPRSSGRFLHWCSAKSAGGEEEYRWDRPICVEACPDGGETVHCPDGETETVRSEEHERGGGVVLVHVAKQRLIPTVAKPTRRLNAYCLPKEFGRGALANLMTHAKRQSWSGTVMHALTTMEDVLERPRLLLALTLMAFASAIVWVFVLRFFAQTMAHGGFVLGSFALLTMGALAMFAPTDLEVVTQLDQGAAAAINATLVDAVAAADPGIAVAAGSAGVVMESMKGSVSQMLMSASNTSIVKDAVGWLDVIDGNSMPKLRFCIGALFVIAGAAMLLWYCYASASITVAADCMSEACRIMSSQPSLLLVLPLLNWVIFISVIFVCVGGCALLLSTAEVHAVSFSINGERVSGVFRNFTWTGHLVVGVAGWFFACLWLQELIAAFRLFVLSHSAARWYFLPTRERSWFPIISGVLVAFIFHFGSLAFGAFILAFLAAFRWFLLLIHEFSQRDNKVVKWILAGLNFLVTIAEQIMKRVNRFAYTDLAINSHTFCESSTSAASIMLENATLIWLRMFVLRPMKFLASIVYAGAFGWGARIVLCLPTSSLQGFVPHLLLEEWEGLGSPSAAGVLAGTFSFLAVRCFTAAINDTSDAMLYCHLWEKRHGQGGRSRAPDDCKSLVGAATMQRAKVD